MKRQVKLKTFSPNSANRSVYSAFTYCWGFFNAEFTDEDAEFAESSIKASSHFKLTGGN